MPRMPNGHRPDIVVCTCSPACLCLCLWQKLNAPATKEVPGRAFPQKEPPGGGPRYHNKAHYMSALALLQVPKVKCSSRTDFEMRETIASSPLISYAERPAKKCAVDTG